VTLHFPVTWKDWELGVSFSLPARGCRLPGLTTIRPWSAALHLGPLSIELEGAGRMDALDAAKQDALMAFWRKLD
jgi:hypothetical protein